MSFADKLKQIRKDKQLSQEDLAALLDVSRQAVSKWEQGTGYPEVETLLILSSKLNVSLDHLMSTEIANELGKEEHKVTGVIIITSPYEHVIVSCHKVLSSGKLRGGKQAPRYALFGVDDGYSFWGQSTTFLAWYADKESIIKEISAIRDAISQGLPTYELNYSVNVERHWMQMKIIHDEKEC